MKCDICGWQPTMNRIEDVLCEWSFHRAVKHAYEIIINDHIIQQSKEALKTRFWSKKEEKWINTAPMDDFSYDLGYAGVIKRDGVDE